VPRRQRIEFKNREGASLAAALEVPDREPKAYALFAHCFTCGKDIAAAARIARTLAAEGFAVLRFDFTGLGGSEGDFANTNFASNVEDLLAAADFLRDNHAAPSLLIGHSLGGTAMLAAAPEIPESLAVACIERWKGI
jgi:putative redox protein